MVHGLYVQFCWNSTPSSDRNGLQHHTAAERASILHVTAKEETRALGNTEPSFGEDRAALRSIAVHLTLTTKEKGVAAERQEGTETNGHQALSIKVDRFNTAAMLYRIGSAGLLAARVWCV